MPKWLTSSVVVVGILVISALLTRAVSCLNEDADDLRVFGTFITWAAISAFFLGVFFLGRIFHSGTNDRAVNLLATYGGKTDDESSRSGNAEDCKSSMRGFDSRPCLTDTARVAEWYTQRT